MAKFEHLRVPTHIMPGNQEHIQSQILLRSGAQNDFFNVVAKSWKVKQINRNQSKSNTICAGNRRKEARFEKKAESTDKIK